MGSAIVNITYITIHNLKHLYGAVVRAEVLSTMPLMDEARLKGMLRCQPEVRAQVQNEKSVY